MLDIDVIDAKRILFRLYLFWNGAVMIYERVFARELRTILRECDAEILPIVGNKMQPGAWPDLYIAHIFYNGWIEFKAEDTLLRPDQVKKISRLKEREVPAYVVRVPNIIEDEFGTQLDTFDSDKGIDLILKLAKLWKDRK